MEGINSGNMDLENTHPVDQNGVGLGDQQSSLARVKLELPEARQQHEGTNNETQQQMSQVQFQFSHQNLLPSQQHLLHSIAPNQSYMLQHSNPVFPNQLSQDTSQHVTHQNQSYSYSFRAPISSYNTLTQSSVDYAKMVTSSVDFTNHVTPLNTASEFNITDLSNATKQIEKSAENMSSVKSISQDIDRNKSIGLISTENDEEKDMEEKDTEDCDDNDDDTTSEEEEDVHQCGRCKEVFHTLKQYMEHKTSKVCKPPKPKKPTTPSHEQQEQQKQQMRHDIQSPNILETAAKNTIFRDSFIPMDHVTGDGSNLELEKDELLSTVDNPFVQHEELTNQQNEDEQKDHGNIKSEFIDPPRRRRGRPPKSSYLSPVSSNPPSVAPNETSDLVDINPDSPPKAKRKSRPPRRHKPDEDNSVRGYNNQTYAENNLPTDAMGNVSLSSLDPSGLPTIENIHKYFSVRGRGRGRGRGRSRHSMHRCPICMLLFPNRLTMMEHKRKHTKTFKCKICNEGFYTEDRLEKHSTKETHNYPCDECERIFVNKQTLMRHKLSHSDKIYKCDMCARAFKTQKDLNNHKLGMHSETHDFVCEVCNKGFSRREKLKRHLMIHAPDRPIFTCPFKNHVGCEKSFYRKDKLTRHLYSHSKVKPFKCDQCDKSFARTDNLREHIRSHTGIFRYYCTVCGKGQPGPKKFVQHMMKQHNVENPEIPKPFEDLAPEPLIRQHKAVVEAETAARIARAATNLKKERDKSNSKLRKEDLETHEIHVDPTGQHITLATMGNIQLQTVNSALIASPQQAGAGGDRNTVDLYSPQFQISRHVPENMVRQLNESLSLVRNDVRELNRDSLTQQSIRHLTTDGTDVRIPDLTRQQLVEPGAHITAEQLRRQITDGTSLQQQSREDQSESQQNQTITHTLTVEAEGGIPVTRSLHLIHQIPGNLQFTTLLNSDLVTIGGEVRNANNIQMFQQKYSQNQ